MNAVAPTGRRTRAEPTRSTSMRVLRWLLPVSGLLALAGYFGPWVPHPAAGLVVTGLDLGEYVKFLPPVQGGQISLWREGFYLPLVTVSLAFSLHAWRSELGYSWPVRTLLLAMAGIAALNLLPPAWTPDRLATPEFRQQSLALVTCLLLAGVSPMLGLLPRWLPAVLVTMLAFLSLWLPAQGFVRVLPTIGELYNQPIHPGWGLWAMEAGLAGVGASTLAIPLKSRNNPMIVNVNES